MLPDRAHQDGQGQDRNVADGLDHRRLIAVLVDIQIQQAGAHMGGCSKGRGAGGQGHIADKGGDDVGARQAEPCADGHQNRVHGVVDPVGDKSDDNHDNHAQNDVDVPGQELGHAVDGGFRQRLDHAGALEDADEEGDADEHHQGIKETVARLGQQFLAVRGVGVVHNDGDEGCQNEHQIGRHHIQGQQRDNQQSG